MWKILFGLHLQENPSPHLRLLRGFPVQFLLPPLPTRRERRAVPIAQGSQTPWHWRDRTVDASTLTHHRAESRHLSRSTAVTLPTHAPDLHQQVRNIPQQRLLALLRAACPRSRRVPWQGCSPQDRRSSVHPHHPCPGFTPAPCLETSPRSQGNTEFYLAFNTESSSPFQIRQLRLFEHVAQVSAPREAARAR